jgi:RND family efflux transporter MFP subunit
MNRLTESIVLLLVVTMMVVSCSGGPSQSQENATPTPIPTPIIPTKPTYEVQRGEIVQLSEFTGRVSPVTEEELFFRTAGYVGTVYVKRDDWVEAGDVLAELEVTDLKNQLAQAEASLESAISNNEQRMAEAQASLEAAELNLAITKANDPSLELVIAEVDLERAQAGLAEAREEYLKALDQIWRPEELRENAAERVHEAELNMKVAEASYQQALQAQKVYAYQIQLQEQELNLTRMQLERLEAGLDIEEIRLTVERLKAQLSDARLTAPFDGQILGVSVAEGRAMEAYRSVLTIGDPSEVELSANLTGSKMEKLTEGMAAICTVSNRPGEEFPGYIRQLPYPYGTGGRTTSGTSGVEDIDESARIGLEITAEEAGLELGDLMYVTVVLERKDDVLWLPPQAIRTFEGRKFVVVQEGDGQRRVDVKIGLESEDRVEIEEGLAEGQIVVGQ